MNNTKTLSEWRVQDFLQNLQLLGSTAEEQEKEYRQQAVNVKTKSLLELTFPSLKMFN